MANYSMDNDPDYWRVPQRFKELAEFVPSTGARCAWYPMGDENDDEAPIAVVLSMEPGYVITRHAHPCERVEVVLRGSIETEGRTFVAGDVMTAHANEFYGPKVCGPEGCTTLEVFAAARGSYTRITEGPDGEPLSTDLLEDHTQLDRSRR